jgi:hypothetical protein
MGKEVEQQTSIKLAVYCDFATGFKKLQIPPIVSENGSGLGGVAAARFLPNTARSRVSIM